MQRWPDLTAIEIQRQPGATASRLGASEVLTTEDGHILERYTYKQLRTVAEQIASWLAEQQLESGSRCAILAANSPRWVATQLAVLACGHTAVPLDTAFTSHQVQKLLDDSGATVLFCDARNLHVASEAITNREVRLVLMDGHSTELPNYEEILSGPPVEFTPVAVAPDTMACLFYTSGTTSDPKGVMITHSNLVYEMDAAFNFCELGPKDALLGVLPLFHVLAQMLNILLPLAGGMRVVFLDSLSSTELMIALRDRGITIFGCVPQFFYLIHERVFGEVAKKGRPIMALFRLMMSITRNARRFGINPGKIFFSKVHKTLGPNVRFFLTGGSRFDPQIGRDFHDLGFDIVQAYGLTETSSGCTATPLNDNVIGSIGKPIKYVKMMVRDPKPDENGNMVGEICVAGPTVMKGYYNRPDANAQSFDGEWFLTGDLGYKDARGNYYITGRAKDVIVLSSGKNIYPEEIESYYLRSPYIKEVCVLGLESGKPGEPMSERLHGVIVPNFEVLRQRKVVNTREVIRYDVESVSATLPSTKRILSYDIWQDDLPRTTTRKIRRNEVERRVKEMHVRGETEPQEMFVRTLTAEEQDWLKIPEVQRAIAVLKKAAKNNGSPIYPKDNLELDLGLDSMERVELLVSLEHALNADVEDSAAAEVYTVREIVDLVRAKAGSAHGQGAGWDTLLAGEPTDPDVLTLTHKFPFAQVFWYCVGIVVYTISKLFFRLEVKGMEKLPRNSAFILSPNHASYIDPPVLSACMPWNIFTKMFYIGTSEIFGEGLMKKFALSFHLFPVDPDANLVPAMRAGAYGLRHGKILVLYPEGERSLDGSPKQFKKGAAILSHTLNVPIVPVAQQGFYEVLPRGFQFQGFHKLRIEIGDPIYPNPSEPPEQAYDRMTAELKTKIVGMWEELGGVDVERREKRDARAAGA
ncbi:MAG TPA: AMP-binding protein [Candidatus Acidoferrales bacterium]|nr:AMP-binding protein [Candidatus Acidoferrales bacterium]